MTKEAPEVSHVWVGGGGLSAARLQVIFFRAGVGGIPGARRPGASLIGPESPPGPPRGRESTKREPTQNAQPCRAGLDCQHHSPRPVATMVPFCTPDPGYGDYQLQPVAVPAASPTLLVELDQGRAKKNGAGPSTGPDPLRIRPTTETPATEAADGHRQAPSFKAEACPAHYKCPGCIPPTGAVQCLGLLHRRMAWLFGDETGRRKAATEHRDAIVVSLGPPARSG